MRAEGLMSWEGGYMMVTISGLGFRVLGLRLWALGFSVYASER